METTAFAPLVLLREAIGWISVRLTRRPLVLCLDIIDDTARFHSRALALPALKLRL